MMQHIPGKSTIIYTIDNLAYQSQPIPDYIKEYLEAHPTHQIHVKETEIEGISPLGLQPYWIPYYKESES